MADTDVQIEIGLIGNDYFYFTENNTYDVYILSDSEEIEIIKTITGIETDKEYYVDGLTPNTFYNLAIKTSTRL